MIINHNIPALNTHRMLGMNHNAAQKAMEKLSSGMRINRAGDDAAGLSISEKMRAQIRGLNQASRNSQDGISLIQTAEGALTETHAILQRMRELVVQAGNLGTNADEDLQAIQDEISQLIDEIDGIANRTEFNGKKLLDGAYAAASGSGASAEALVFQIGANKNQRLELHIEKMDSESLGLGASGSGSGITNISEIDVTKFGDSGYSFDEQLDVIDAAIKMVSKQRSELGAVQNRLEHTINNLDNAAENLQAAESRIRDTDMAKEIMEFTRANILSQASQAMLAQANQLPQAVLQLLG